MKNAPRLVLDALYHLHAEHLGQLRSSNERYHDLAWELDDVEQRIHRLQHQRAQSPDRGSVDYELTRLEHQRNTLEDTVLHTMLHMDELAARVDLEWQTLDRFHAECGYDERCAAVN